jgi:hypothetical protein
MTTTSTITRLAENHATLQVFSATGRLPVNCDFKQLISEYVKDQESLGVRLHNEHYIPFLERDYDRYLQRKRDAWAKKDSRKIA